MSFDPVAFVENAHRLGGDLRSWTCALAPELLPELDDPWLGGMAVVLDGSSTQLVATMPGNGSFDRAVERWLRRDGVALAQLAAPCGITSLAESGATRRFADGPVRDVVALSVSLGEGTSAVFGVATKRQARLDAPIRRFWHRLAVHLGASFIGHRNAEQALTTVPRSRAASLRQAVRESERREGTQVNPSSALDLWYGLLSGRWMLVDRFDDDGRRYLVARRGEPTSRAPLTRRQRQVVFHASLGCANGEIAHALGVADNTVSAHLHRALQKLNIGSRAELVKLSTRVTAAVTPRSSRSPRP
jgi:DNA-binding CsgD family transcriptional regulator